MLGVKVDKQLKLLWQEASERLRQAAGNESGDWDAKWEAVGDIVQHEPPLYLAGGFKTTRAFIAASLPGENERSVRRAIRVARHFAPDDERKYGPSNLDALLDYLEARGPLGEAKVHPERQKVRIPEGKRSRLVPFARVTVEQLHAATRAARGRQPSHEPPLVKTLRARLGKNGLRSLSVHFAAGHVSLGGIAPDKLIALGRALAKLRPSELP
ncbi:MAG: hypothetical protein ACHQ17_02330 [Polyangia bacterium]|jgi:hypothetical protein